MCLWKLLHTVRYVIIAVMKDINKELDSRKETTDNTSALSSILSLRGASLGVVGSMNAV